MDGPAQTLLGDRSIGLSLSNSLLLGLVTLRFMFWLRLKLGHGVVQALKVVTVAVAGLNDAGWDVNSGLSLIPTLSTPNFAGTSHRRLTDCGNGICSSSSGRGVRVLIGIDTHGRACVVFVDTDNELEPMVQTCEYL